MRNFLNNRLLAKPLIVAAASLSVAIPATADDTEVFTAALAAQNKPNLLFVLDYSGSMQRDVEGNETDVDADRKINILKTAVSDLLENNKDKVNVGIGSLYNKNVSGVRWPISDLQADAHDFDANIPEGEYTVSEVISRQLARSNAKDATSTVGALAEAAAYFRGDAVLHNDANEGDVSHHRPDVWDNDLVRDGVQGGYDNGNQFAAIPSSYEPNPSYLYDGDGSGYSLCTDTADEKQCEGKVTYDCNDYEASTSSWEATADSDGGSRDRSARTVCKYEHEHSWSTPTYISPIKQECQSNFIVLISDGQPTRVDDNTTLETVLKAAGVASGKKADCEDLALSIFAGEPDNQQDGNCGIEITEYLANNNVQEDVPDSNVLTYTVGFSLDGAGANYLEALSGGPDAKRFFEASNPAALTTALNDVLDSILAGSQNFAELSIDIDPATFSHDDKTYFSLFSPSSKNSWKGNLKGFFVDEDGLVDLNGNVATFDDSKGIKFADTSQSFWSSVVDGNDTDTGGASESITSLPVGPNDRNMYTYMGGGLQELKSTNTNIPVPAEALNWLANAPMGDPLHTKPVVLNYNLTGNEVKRVVYTMTNQGFLHAFDATLPNEPGTPADPTDPSDTGVPGDTAGGAELFAFMPEELLPNIVKLHNPTFETGHVYGLDGGITRWHEDENKNGVVDDGEDVLLVFGMRRGGSSYYAIDVSTPQTPDYKWQLSPSDPDFGQLAQTWSRPSLVTVSTGPDEDDVDRVLMFGGGYDADVTDGSITKEDAEGGLGNVVYMIDKNKNEIMTISSPELNYSIPSDLSVVDTDNDGAVDRAYFGDVGGQVWRADFDDVSFGAYTLKKLADLDDGTYQPLYYPPSISKNKYRGESFIAVSIGSGDRTQPLSELSANNFYMLRDYDVKQGPTSGDHSLITPSNLHDATLNPVGSTVEATRVAAELELSDPNNYGWLVKLNGGEKSLSRVVTYQGKYIATTFEPEEAVDINGDPDACGFAMIGRLYIMDILDARPIEIAPDGSEIRNGLEAGKRVTLLNGTTIPSKPVIRYTADTSKAQIFVDKESVATINKQLTTVFWHAK